jgi:hypothetical protein
MLIMPLLLFVQSLLVKRASKGTRLVLAKLLLVRPVLVKLPGRSCDCFSCSC